MKAAVLEDVAKMVVRNVPDPAVPPREVALRVKAVGVCGTDLHLFRGHGNYNLDAQGRPIPLREQPRSSATNSRERSWRWGGKLQT